MSKQNKKDEKSTPTNDNYCSNAVNNLVELREIRYLLRKILNENIKRNLKIIFKSKNYDDIIDEKLIEINELMLNGDNSIENLYLINKSIEEVVKIINGSKRKRLD